MKVKKRPNVVGNVYIADLGVTVSGGGIDLTIYCSPDDIRRSYNSGSLQALKKKGLITTIGSLPPPGPLVDIPSIARSEKMIEIPELGPVDAEPDEPIVNLNAIEPPVPESELEPTPKKKRLPKRTTRNKKQKKRST